MRPIDIGMIPPNATLEQKVNWIIAALYIIQRASQQYSAESAADAITLEGTHTPTYTFDLDTASASETKDVLGTLIYDLKRRGPKGV